MGMNGVMGFDPSLRSAGYCFLSEGVPMYGVITPGEYRGFYRMRFIRDEFMELLEISRASLVAYEGYAMNAVGRRHDQAELGGILKMLAWECGIDVLLVPPATLKLFMTGQGKSDKAAMRKAIQRRWGVTISQDDAADAYALMRLGQCRLDAVMRREEERADTALCKCEYVKGLRG